MTVQHVSDLSTPIGDLLKTAGSKGIVLEADAGACYALIPLDESLLDYLIERSPKFIEDCRQIRERMQAGQFHTHEAVKKLLAK